MALHEIPRREMRIFDDLDVEKAKALIAEALDGHDQRYLTQAECRPLLDCYRLPLLRAQSSQTAEEAAQMAESFGTSVVMKVMSADVVHKFDAGGALLIIHGADERGGVQEDLPDVSGPCPAPDPGILIEEMARKGVEVILRASRDPASDP